MYTYKWTKVYDSNGRQGWALIKVWMEASK